MVVRASFGTSPDTCVVAPASREALLTPTPDGRLAPPVVPQTVRLDTALGEVRVLLPKRGPGVPWSDPGGPFPVPVGGWGTLVTTVVGRETGG